MPKAKKAVKPAEAKVVAPVAELVKTRKPYPGRAERIEMAEQKIARLEKLNAERTALVAKTETKLAERREALARSTRELEDAVQLRDKLVAAQTRPVRSTAAKAVKAAEKAEFDALKAKLEAQGKTVQDLLNEMG